MLRCWLVSVDTAAVRSHPPASEALSQKARCAAFHRCLSTASPRDAARLRGVLRVLREWILARSAPASPLARACALHLLCRDAGFLHDAGMIVLAGLGVLIGAAGCRRACACALRARSCEFRRPQSPRARAYTLLCMTVLFSSTGILAALYDQRERHVGAPLRNADLLHDSYVGVPQRPRHGSRRLSRARRGQLQLLQTTRQK